MGNGRGVLLRLAVHHVRRWTGPMTTAELIDRIDALIAECWKAQDELRKKLSELTDCERFDMITSDE